VTRFRSTSPLLAFAVGVLAAALPPAASAAKGRWMNGFGVTEYYPAPEAWFAGKRVSAPGLPGKHRIDWLYSSRGLSMEGDGVGLDGRRYHISSLGRGGWINSRGLRTAPTRRPGSWTRGLPLWRAGGYWRSGTGLPTFPLESGGWWRGTGIAYVAPPPGISFAAGPSRPLRFWHSVAVDPDVIPLGSKVYIPAYKGHGGWFRADDIGGAIIGRHLDVYRTPPATPSDSAFLPHQRVYVISR
jgi:3D (Asp-Asp-Asp) domain-containing protein